MESEPKFGWIDDRFGRSSHYFNHGAGVSLCGKEPKPNDAAYVKEPPPRPCSICYCKFRALPDQPGIFE